MTTVNMDEMARVLRISLPTMRKLVKRYDGFPVVSEGGKGVEWQFEPADVIEFLRARREEEVAAKAAKDELLAQISLPLEEDVPAEERGLSASDRLKNAQAMLKEDEVAKTRGFLVLKSDLRGPLSDVFVQMSQFLQSLPVAIGRRHNLPDAVVRDMRALITTQQRSLHGKLVTLVGALNVPAEETGGDGSGA